MSAVSPPELKDFRCSYCAKSFGRAEHRRRHELIHTEDRPFRCQSCPKDFVRRDALQRHELTHQAAPNLLQRGGRACRECAGAKARCSGDVPCTRCRDRSAQCTFPNVSASVSGGTPDGTAHAQHLPLPAPPPQQQMQSAPTAAGPQLPYIPAPMPGNEQLHVPEVMDFDFWDQNVLSATNWLDALDNAAFAGYPLMAINEPFFSPFGTSAPTGAGVTSTPSEHNRSQGSPHSIFSPRSVAVTEGNTSHTSYDGPSEVGQYYVDGEPARLPRVKRRKISQSQPALPNETTAAGGFSLQMRPLTAPQEQGSFVASSQTYSAILDWYQRLCITPPPGWKAFESVEFPSLDVLNHLLHLYQKHYAQTLPFLHPVAFADVENKDALVIAMAAIGTHYVEDTNPSGLIRSMHEFVRRLLLHQQESTQDDFSQSRAGTELLYLVGSAYCGDDGLRKHALNFRHRLATISSEARRIVGSLKGKPGEGDSCESKWHPWIRRESAIRLAYSAWMVDGMYQYHFQSHRVLGLKHTHLPLPAEDKIWNATTEEEWKGLSKALQTPTLNEALQSLYIEKNLSKDRGEFARILLIHGLYHRMWEVGDYLSNPLSHWEPTANRQASSEVLPTTPIWLPAIPTFTKWQNSACDCLDVLHWQANATIGQASGLEHPTVLHLHLARIILLTPHAEITNLAKAMTSSVDRQSDEMLTNKRLIQRWAIQHQYKARLAIIHAGVVFWHVRRYSVDGFYEAPAVALAALTLWAFGTYSNNKALSRATSRQPSQRREVREESDQSDESSCDIILLDRPADDEIVQQFIRSGHKMKAHVAGSDLYAPKGPERALRQGCKLLASLRCWGVSSSWNKLLQGLVDGLQKSSAKS